MRTEQIKINEISQDAFSWLQAKYKAVDSMNAQAYAQFLSDDCRLMFANNPVAQGKELILDGINHFWSSIGGLNHSFVNILGGDYHLAAEALIDYTRKDGNIVTIPCVTMIERNAAGLATSIRIFIDTAPIYTA